MLVFSYSLLKEWGYLTGTSKTLQVSLYNPLSPRTFQLQRLKINKRHTLRANCLPFIFQTSTKAPKPVRQPSLDLPTTSMMVASTKSLWETGEVTAQSAVKPSACKVRPLEDLLCLCWRQGHNVHCPCLSCWYVLFVGPTSSKGIYVRGLSTCCKALCLGDSVFLVRSPIVPRWYI